MISFESDYTTGAHPEILRRLGESNLEHTSGYGTDGYCASAIEKIKQACQCEQAQIYFAIGGTQTNQLVISTMLQDYEGVVAAETGHVAAHEAGAIEHSGHKVLTIPSHQGKMQANELEAFVKNFYEDGNHEHMVFPGMVYLSQPTEYGSLYAKQELEQIAAVCKAYEMTLYVDGARLGYALASEDNDITLPELAKLADVFYIGGTKVGAFCGEAIVFTKNNMPKHFIPLAKQRGALIAKGRLLGIQFDTLFTDDLYLQCGKHAMKQKKKLVSILKNAGFEFFYESPTNQQFVIIEDEKLKKLREKVAVSFWEKKDENHTVIRFCSSWSTTDEDLAALEQIVKECC